MKLLLLLLPTCIALGSVSTLGATLTLDFEELPLNGKDYYNGSDLAGGFSSFGAYFNNVFIDFEGDCCWSGWAYSQTTDNETPGPANQYSAFPGSGAGDSAKYAVAYSGLGDSPALLPTISLPTGAEPAEMQIANTTYAVQSMRTGDSFAKKFGGLTGTDPDWFELTVQGLDQNDSVVAEVNKYLADYRPAGTSSDLLLEDWETLDLSPLAGYDVRKLVFRLDSSDHGSFGMNTPAYVAIDNLQFEVYAQPGDFNFDGVVDQVDLTAWQAHFGTTFAASFNHGDADEDGDVDGHDFLVWQRNSSPFPPISNPVPEPNTTISIFGLLLLNLPYLLRMRHLA